MGAPAIQYKWRCSEFTGSGIFIWIWGQCGEHGVVPRVLPMQSRDAGLRGVGVIFCLAWCPGGDVGLGSWAAERV